MGWLVPKMPHGAVDCFCYHNNTYELAIYYREEVSFD